MLPLKIKTGVTIGVLLWCFSSQLGVAGEYQTNLLYGEGRDCNSSESSVGCSEKQGAVQEYAAFQDLPLNCNACSGAKCQESLRNPRKCEGDPLQDCVTVFDKSGQVVRRGCEAEVAKEYQTHCQTNPELCFNCKAHGCNTVNDADSYQNCLDCDAATHPDCLFNPAAVNTTRKCVEGCLSALYPRKSNKEIFEFARSCYEDIDEDDREACTAQNNCIRCTDSDLCNDKILPVEGRLSCLHCDGGDCHTPVTKKCLAYSTSDQCYIHFDNVTHSAIRMGCKSELTTDEIRADLKQYYLCDGDDCNSYENLPPGKICIACDSTINEYCAINPVGVNSILRCQIQPHTQCYVRVREDGATERGCLHDLAPADFTDCHTGISNCRICEESNCNLDIYPANRLQCHRCNSTNNARCETDPIFTTTCTIYDPEDSCVTKLKDGITYRGCSSEFNCTGESRKNCRTCIGNGCNAVNLAELSIGDPGRFQPLPLNCYHCNGAKECGDGKSLGRMGKCEGDKLQTCTVAFALNGSVIARGCSDDLEAVCDQVGNVCHDCKSSGCNLAQKKADYLDCVFCDAQENEACLYNISAVTRTRKCHKSCMTVLYPRTGDATPAYELLRTCLDDMDLDERVDCAAGENANCKACEGEKCNTVSLGVRKTCNHCTDKSCAEPQQRMCRATLDNDQCFIEYGSIIEMGCKSKYDEEDVKERVKAKRLWLCDEDNCNDLDNVPAGQTCAICNSRTDAACAIAPETVQSRTDCMDTPFTQCYTRTLENGHTERGCLSSLEGDQIYDCLHRSDSSGCSTCVGDNCNQEVYPKGRRSCQVCNSTTNNKCESTPASKQICLKYTNSDQCVTQLNGDGHTIRGCGSELTCNATNTNMVSCQVCHADNCNTGNIKRKADGKPGIWQPLPLTCHSCSSEAGCGSLALPKTCSTDEYCMTVFGGNGAVVARGCSAAMEREYESYCDTHSDSCHNCNSNLCNRASSQSDFVDCIYCDTLTSDRCVADASAGGITRKCLRYCMTALYLPANSSVYQLTRSCLDDKEEDGQQQCLQQGDQQQCVACESAACNTVALPADRRHCYTCEGDNCEDPESKPCRFYEQSDECFMLFSNESEVVRMGCVSELEADDVERNAHLLLTCSEGDNCNDYAKIPATQICVVCNSHEDPECATVPQNVAKMQHCTTLPNTQCYTRVQSNGATERGCVSQLSRFELRGCLSGNDTDCVTCDADRCNIDIYPENRRRCQRCNSEDTPGCENSIQASSVCPFYSEDEFCTVKLVNGVTYRGCSSEFQCDESDKTFCRHCYGANNCNTVDLATGSIGYPGRWQGIPINCYTCHGEQCRGISPGAIKKCAQNALQNCGTVFAENGTVLQRGCSDQIYEGEYAQYCDEKTANCKFCKSSGCNQATRLIDYVDCVYCDEADNQDCLYNSDRVVRRRSCHKECMTALYARSNELNPLYDLERTCLDDLELDDRLACAKGNIPFCKACTGEACNRDVIPQNRAKCLVCDDNDCEAPKSRGCHGYRDPEKCFTLFDTMNSAKRMGCANDLDASFIETNRRQLLQCEGDDCNRFENIPSFLSCAVCNSTQDVNCAINPKSLSLYAACQDLPYTQCYTHIDQAGITHRGCVSDISDELFDDCISGNSTTCEICNTNNCNSEIYPFGRRSCQRCYSEQDPTCENSPKFASVCPIYKEQDKCVTQIEDESTVRGCSSEFVCDASNREKCRLCETSNCNTINLLASYVGEPGRWQELPLQCYSCSGTDCDIGSIEKCDRNNLQTCVTVFDDSGNVRQRGCSDTVALTKADYCDEHVDKCLACKSNNCNNATQLQDFDDCYFCDSAVKSSCAADLSITTRTRKCQGGCMVALYPRSSSNDTSYETSRSCLDDLIEDDRTACIAGERENCKACIGERCNTMILPPERFECNKCVGTNCEDIATRKCSAHLEQDQCYILFDEESSIIGMGCRSEFETDALTELLKQKQILLCEGKNCNTYDKVPSPKTCAVCNSAKNERCATNPNLVGATERCSVLPYTDCYTLINQNNHTERGCLSSLDGDSFYGCQTQNDGLCQTCAGDRCNENDIFPANRLKCHHCSSSSDPLCTTKPNSNSICPIYNENDVCVTSLVNGVTTRGCGSSIRCAPGSNILNCRTCNTQGCNTINLDKVNNDGQPGRWQPVPINCLTCKGAEQCTGVGQFQPCENNPYQNCKTVFDTNGKVIQRGCRDTVDADNDEYCEANGGKCPGCNSNGCNTAKSLNDYVECINCDTETNGSCIQQVGVITKTRMCHKHCLTALYPREQGPNPSYGLSRSCYDDLDLDEREACAAGSKEHCQVCSTNKCNAAAMPAKRLSCNVCQGSEDCKQPNPAICYQYRPNDECYLHFDEKQVVAGMGCRSDLNNVETDYLLRQKLLRFCKGDNCNTIAAIPAPQTCMLCNSRTDVLCGTTPSNLTSSTTCDFLPYTECYARISSEGSTERGCVSSLNGNDFLGCINGTAENCHICIGRKCNQLMYPENRAQCHICNSLDDPDCEASPDSLSACPVYVAGEDCITSYSHGVTYRGCNSGLTCKFPDPKTCAKCTGIGCNTINLARKQDDNFGKWQDLPLRCLSCSGSNCDSVDTTQTRTCENNNMQDCMTVFDTTGKVVSRGCSDAVIADYERYCNQNEDSCYSCKSNECNTATEKSEYRECVYCNSNKDVDCIWQPLSDAHNTRKCQGDCMTALFPSSHGDNSSYDLIRTCLKDKEADDQLDCAQGLDKNCRSCNSDKCNVDDIPADRHHCYFCNDGDCAKPESKLCPIHSEDRRCFILFVIKDEIAEMGCMSSLRNTSFESILRTKRVQICDGKNCNSLDKIPTSARCVSCDSTTNANCSTNPEDCDRVINCNNKPYTSCYTRVENDGSTHRGCLPTLPTDDFVDCVLGEGGNCEICEGIDCNKKIFPADRLQCFTCNSEEHDDCESFPSDMFPCRNTKESCVTVLSGNVTLRGCSNDLLCDSEDSKTCRSCNTTLCNSIDLRNKVDDGNHGTWQALPLKCHSCAGEQCLHSLGPALTCQRNIHQDCMTVFNSIGEVQRRGCADDVKDYEDLYCRLHPAVCKACKSNECNIARNRGDYVECAYCNVSTNPLCTKNPDSPLMPTRSCYKECMLATTNDDLIRTCLDDKELVDRLDCRTFGGGPNCTSCAGDNCNRFTYPADRLKCYECTDSECTSTILNYCEHYEKNNFCFAKYENGKVDLMGCGSAVNRSDIIEWTSQKKLYRCEGNECNELARLPTTDACVACDSSKNANCAQDPSLVDTTDICIAPHSKCVIKLNAVGHTLRGCLSALPQDDQDSCESAGTCDVCRGEKCNGEVFPTNRRQCHICSSADDGKCKKSPAASKVCPIYGVNDRCFSKNNNGLIERGCGTSFTCNINERNCKMCDFDNCNTADVGGGAGLLSSSLLLTLLSAFVATVAFNSQ